MTNRDATEKVFAHMRDEGFEPYNIQYGNGYFVFEMGEDSVCEFRVRGFRGWRFGMWVETNPAHLTGEDGTEYPAVQLFFTHKDNCDKFRPNRCFFHLDFKLDEIEAEDSPCLWEIEERLRFVKHKPIAAYVMDATDTAYYSRSNILYFLRLKAALVRYEGHQKWLDVSTYLWQRPKTFFLNKFRIIDEAKFLDGNSENCTSYPRYDMRIRFKNLYDNEEKQDAAEARIMRVWFRKGVYKNMNVLLYREGLNHPYSFE